MPNDHHVPQVHLRRFAIPGAGRVPREWYVDAAEAATPDIVFRANTRKVAAQGDFYTFSDLAGDESRSLESFFGDLENEVAPVFRLLLDDPEFALTDIWPLPPRMRGTLARFVAAQILRTTRQRKRLDAWGASTSFTVPGAIGSPDPATVHARYIAATLEDVASALWARPWGLGFTNACLPTSDCPVVILDAHDDEDQVGAALLWDVVFPLDPHRFIFMPSRAMVDLDGEKSRDHRLILDGVGLFLVDAIFAAADRYIYMHPGHRPALDATRSPRLPPPGAERRAPQYVIQYPVLEAGLTVRAHWATHHIPVGDRGGRARFTGESFGL